MELPIWLRTTLYVYKDLKDPRIEVISDYECSVSKIKKNAGLAEFSDILILMDENKVYYVPIFEDEDEDETFEEELPETIDISESRIDRARSRRIQINPFEFEPDEKLLKRFVFHVINELFEKHFILDSNHGKAVWFMVDYLFPGIPNREKMFSVENLKQNLRPEVLEIFTAKFLLTDSVGSQFFKKPRSLSELKQYLDLVSDRALFEVIYRHSRTFVGRDTELEKDDLETAKRLADAINKAYFVSDLLVPRDRKRKLNDLIQITLNTIPLEEMGNLINKKLLNKIRKNMMECF